MRWSGRRRSAVATITGCRHSSAFPSSIGNTLSGVSGNAVQFGKGSAIEAGFGYRCGCLSLWADEMLAFVSGGCPTGTPCGRLPLASAPGPAILGLRSLVARLGAREDLRAPLLREAETEDFTELTVLLPKPDKAWLEEAGTSLIGAIQAHLRTETLDVLWAHGMVSSQSERRGCTPMPRVKTFFRGEEHRGRSYSEPYGNKYPSHPLFVPSFGCRSSGRSPEGKGGLGGRRPVIWLPRPDSGPSVGPRPFAAPLTDSRPSFEFRDVDLPLGRHDNFAALIRLEGEFRSTATDPEENVGTRS